MQQQRQKTVYLPRMICWVCQSMFTTDFESDDFPLPVEIEFPHVLYIYIYLA